MRLQFVIGYDYDNTVEIDVTRIPTEEESQAIENEIYEAMDLYEEENGDLYDFDYYYCISNAVEKHMSIAENQVVKTFYIYEG